nr:folylpolyglutamate synthase [Quercus suber]
MNSPISSLLSASYDAGCVLKKGTNPHLLGLVVQRPRSAISRSAIETLDRRKRRVRPDGSLQTAPSPAKNGRPELRGTPSLKNDIDALNIIHIAGTKGKGSTCAFTESILRSHGQRTGFPRRTGLYSSPHLIHPEERIRIDGQPLDRGLFAKYLFEVYDRLPQLATEYDINKSAVERGPRYLQLFALLAFHVFIREKIDAVILETHNGGEYDATNVVAKPFVAAITTLGMDHIDMLGPTIQDIAWHKSGIYKPGAVALSTMQDEAPSKVLAARAQAQGEKVQFIDVDSRLPVNHRKLQPSVQLKNASLALNIAQAFLGKAAATAETGAQELSSEDISDGIAQFSWPGRFQIVPDGDRTTWFLDSAHNEMSVAIAVQWFAKTGAALLQQRQEDGKEQQQTIRTLMFAHVNALRDSVALLEALARALKIANVEVEYVILSTYEVSEQQIEGHIQATFERLRYVLKKFLPDAKVWEEPTIQGAMEKARTLGVMRQQHTLITGSQHLVGPALQILQARGVDISGGEDVVDV